MTLDKAIELGISIKKVCKGLFPPEEQTAMSLLIEAGKEIKRNRPIFGRLNIHLLPGETEE